MRRESTMLQRVWAGVLTVSFVLTSTMVPCSNAFAIGQQEPWLVNLTPPSRFGDITDAFHAPQSDKLIVLLQDLHFNLSVQQNLHQLIRFYEKQFLNAPIAVEGASGPLDYSVLTNSHNDEERRGLSSFLLKHAEITGAEAYAIADNHPNALFGVENEKYYRTHLALFRTSFDDRQALSTRVSALESQLQTLSRQLRHVKKAASVRNQIKTALERLELIEALLAQRVTLSEARLIAQHLPETVSLLDALLPILPSPVKLSKKELEDAIRASIDFYALALLRNDPLTLNTLNLLNNREAKAVIQVAGGFHTDGITQALKAKGISFVVVTPQVKAHTAKDEQTYTDRLMNRHTDLGAVERDSAVFSPSALGRLYMITEPSVIALVKRYFEIRATIQKKSRVAQWMLKTVVLNGFGLGILTGVGGGGYSGVPNGKSTEQFSAEVRAQVSVVGTVMRLSREYRNYLLQMLDQYSRPDDPNQQLTIDIPSVREGNFRLAVNVPAGERERVFGEIPYAEILANDSRKNHASRASKFKFTWSLLHGGIGENVGRTTWLAKRLGIPESEVKLGAKGTDLGYDVQVNGKTLFVGAAELQLLRAIDTVREKRVGELVFQPIVNKGSAPSFHKLFNSPVLEDRINGVSNPRTYRDLINESGLLLEKGNQEDELLWQSDLPAIQVEKESEEVDGIKHRNTKGTFTSDEKGYRQPGGHGQLGVYFMLRAKEEKAASDRYAGHFRVFSNGDNANAQLYEQVAPFMQDAGIAVVQFNKRASFMDRKGGKVGLRRTPQGIWVPDMMELAQAKAADKFSGTGTQQQDAFYNAGQGEGEMQPFNLNGYLMDEDRLHDLLSDVQNELGEDGFLRVIAPTLIHKPAKTGKDGKLYIPIDGTIGSVMHNINAWFMTDPRGQAILKKHGMSRFLAYANVPDEGFAPVKSVSDQYLQANSDAFTVDLTRKMVVADPAFRYPEVEFVGYGRDGKDDGYWTEYQRMIDALGHLKVLDLEELYVKGAVVMRDAKVAGTVRINNLTGQPVNLRDPEFLGALKKAGIATQDATDNSQLVFSNVEVTITADRQIKVNTLAPSQVNYRPRDIALNAATVGLSGALLAVGGLLAHTLVGVLLGGLGIFVLVSAGAKLHFAITAGRHDARLANLPLWRLLASRQSIASRSDSGILNIPASSTRLSLRALLAQATAIGHETGSHGLARNEAFAQLLDIVAIPVWLMHAFVIWFLSRFMPSLLEPKDAALHSEITKIVGSEAVAHLLSGMVTVVDGRLVLNNLSVGSSFTGRLKVLFGFKRDENDLLTHAYAQLAAAA